MSVRRILTFVAMTLISSAVVAGYVQPVPVDVDLDAEYALGDMFTARTDEGANVFIGCGVRYVDLGGGLFAWGFCQAEDADGDKILCYTQNEALLDRVRSTSDYSFITFSWTDDGNGGAECVRVGFSTQSFYLPKK